MTIEVEPSTAVCLGGRLRGAFGPDVQQSWQQHFIRPSYALFLVGDEDELNSTEIVLPIRGYAIQRIGENVPSLKPCNGGPDGREGFNHIFMAKLYNRWPRCLGLIERYERLQQRGGRFEFVAFARPDVLWSKAVPHLAILWRAHRHGRDLLTWDDHMAIGRREHASAFFLGAAHAVHRCASVAEWMIACDLLRVQRYRSKWPTPNGKPLELIARESGSRGSINKEGGGGGGGTFAGLTETLYRAEIARVLENRGTPCSPLRLAAATENVSFCDCGLLHTVGGRCLTVDGGSASAKEEVRSSARIAGTRPHPWVGQRHSDRSDACSGSFNLDAATHRNFWLRLPPRLSLAPITQRSLSRPLAKVPPDADALADARAHAPRAHAPARRMDAAAMTNSTAKRMVASPLRATGAARDHLSTCEASRLQMRLGVEERHRLEGSLRPSAAARLASYVCSSTSTRGASDLRVPSNLAEEGRCADPYGCLCLREGDCSHGMSKLTSYLPDGPYISSLQQQQPAPGKARAVAASPAATALLGRLIEQQFPSVRPCPKPAYAGYWNAGFGATFHYVLANTKRAFRDNKTVIFIRSGSPTVNGKHLDESGRWNYAFCESGGLECVFEAHHGCEGDLPPVARNGHSYGSRPRPDPRSLTYPVRRPDEDPNWQPAASRGVFEFISILAGFHWRLKPEVLEEVRRTSARMRLPPRYLGVHMRRGDACASFGGDMAAALRRRDRWCSPVSEYARQVLLLSDRYALNTVYVATDENSALHELRHLLRGKGLTLVSQPTRFSGSATNASRSIELAIHEASPEAKRDAAIEVATDVVLLAQSSAFLASFSSMLSRIVLELAYFHTGVVPPYVSMEFNWCWGGFSYVPVQVRGGHVSRYPC